MNITKNTNVIVSTVKLAMTIIKTISIDIDNKQHA